MTQPQNRSFAPPLTSEQEAALKLLRGSQRILLTGHERPDGDCLGAQAALCSVLRQLGATVVILNPDPPEPQFDYLSREVEYGSFDAARGVPDHQLTVLLDGSELSRCGALGEVLAGHPSRKLVIDHHIHPGQPWWDAAFQDVGAAATGLLVRRIARACDVPLDRLQALGVFTSLVTDTGWFKYSNTDAETLATAAELVDFGIRPAELYGAIYQRRTSDQPGRVAQVLDRLGYHADGRLALVSLPLDPDDRAPAFDSEDVLDLLRAVDQVEVVLFVRETAPGTCKLSARSKSAYDVNALARRFGGGGHAKASGATIEGPLDEVCSRLVEAALEGFAAGSRGGGTGS